MNLNFDHIEKLIEYEKQFITQIIERNILILRDVHLEEHEYLDIKDLIKKTIRSNGLKMLKEKTPLCISLFLVWCVIYNYKDGDMWGPVLKEINVTVNAKNERIFGEIFLNTINKYDLLSVKDSGAKKYLSPILMHGYISDYYTKKLFDRLNRLYEIVLERNTSDLNIESQWDIMFQEDSDIIFKLSIKKELESEVIELENELRDFSSQDYFLDFSKEELKKGEDELVEIRKEVDELNKENDRCLSEIEVFRNIIIESNEVISKTEFLKNGSNNEVFGIFRYINESFKTIHNEVEHRLMEIKTRHKHLADRIKKLLNEDIIKQRRIIENKTKVTILGSGDLDYGWELVEEFKRISRDLNTKKTELGKIEKSIKLEAYGEYNNFIQTYTASLYHLNNSNPDIFKKFIIQILQMMDTYFRFEEIDHDAILSKQFINWFNDVSIKQRNNDRDPIDSTLKNDRQVPKGKIERKNKIKRIDNLKEPYLSLSNDKYSVELIIPEQSFQISHSIDTYPTYKLTYVDGLEVVNELPIQRNGNRVIIHEHKIVLRKEVIDLTVIWLNLRNIFRFEPDTVTIFNSSGKTINNRMLENGLYYVLLSENWSLDNVDYISKRLSSITKYWILEIPINETSLTLKNNISLDNFLLQGSKYNNISIEDINLVDGITSDGLEIIVGSLPRLIYNSLVVNPDQLSINVKIDKLAFMHKNLNQSSQKDDFRENVFLVDLNKILKRKYKYPVRVDIEIIDNEGIKKFNICFVWISNTTFKFEGNELVITYPEKCRVMSSNVIIENYKARVKLLNPPFEEVQLYYDGFGIKKFIVEIPSIEFTIRDRDSNHVEKGTKLLKEELGRIKNYFVDVIAAGNSIKSIGIYNSNESLDVIVPLRRGQARIGLDSIIDFLCEENNEDILKIRWIGKTLSGNEDEIIRVYRDWMLSRIDVFQEETEDEFVLEIKYNENFNYSGEKLIRVLNDSELIFEKGIKEDNPFYYIKKETLKSNNIAIEIHREKQSGLFASKSSKWILVSKTEIILKSRIDEIELIKKSGIVLKSFSNRKIVYDLIPNLYINNITDGEPLNFTGEAIYNGVVSCSGVESEVIFYLNPDSKKVPILLDKDRDGAQYDLDSRDVFWEIRSNKNVLAPIEDFEYDIREE